MREVANLFLTMDLEKCNWHAYNDCFGTSEEKHLIKYIENEKDLKLWSFKTGNAFEPDYVLFLRKKGNDDIYDTSRYLLSLKVNI